MKKIKVNKIKCTHCNDVIESVHTHDFKTCQCGTVSIDGGKSYLKRSFKYSPSDYIDLSEYEDYEVDNKIRCINMASSKKMNKTQMVLEHLKTFGTITSLEAIEKYGATRLSSIIYNLRKRGYKITTIDMPFKDRFGDKSNYGKYVLETT